MRSPAQRHYERVSAEQAAASGAPGGSLAGASAYELMLAKLASDRRRLKPLASIELTRTSGDSYRYHVSERENYACVRAHWQATGNKASSVRVTTCADWWVHRRTHRKTESRAATRPE